MMDHFLEEVVIKKNRTLENILYILCNVLMVVCALLAVFWLNVLMNAGFHWMTVVSLLVMAGIAVGLFFYRDRFRMEYEYTFTNGDLDFAIVYNNLYIKSAGSRIHCRINLIDFSLKNLLWKSVSYNLHLITFLYL